MTLTLARLRDAYAGGANPASIVAEQVKRAEALNTEHHLFITLMGREAADAAGKLGARPGPSPLWGAPYAAKDLFQTKGVRTTAGSRVLADWVPTTDALVLQRLADAGALLIGKANQHEFAHGITGVNATYGTVPNPWNKACLAGGSSSGSTGAVAHGLAAFALGSDTGGSVRVPAALTGIVGLKPTYGLVSSEGMIPYCWSLDHVGTLTRSVADAAALLAVLADPDPADASHFRRGQLQRPKPAELRIGVPRDTLLQGVEPDIARALADAIGFLDGAGAKLRPIDLPDLDEARTVSLLVQMPEALSYHRRYMPAKLDLYGEDLRSGLVFGQFILAEQYVSAKRMIERYRRALARSFAEIDLLLTPTCAIAAPRIGATTVTVDGREHAVGNALTRFTGLFNMTGNPAISVPAGLDRNRMPIGLQLVGHPFAEDRVLGAAALLEERFGTLDVAAPR